MNKKALLALLLAMTLLLSSCALVVKHDDVDQNRAIITMDGKVLATKAQVQSAVNSNLDYLVQYYANNYGYTVDKTSADVIASVRSSVIQSLQEDAVKEAKIAEMGLELTEEEIASVNETFQSYHEMLLAFGIATPSDVTTADEFVGQYFGVTSASMLAEAKENKLKAAVTTDVTVTDADLQAALDEKAASEKTTYESTPDSYGSKVNAGTTVYYRPAGYRMVKNLLIKFEEADNTLISAIKAKVTEQTTAMSNATSGIDTTTELGDLEKLLTYVTVKTVAGETVDGVVEYTAEVTDTFPATEDEATQTLYSNVRTYAQAQALAAAWQADLQAATDAGLAKIQPKVDAVMARLNAGEDFTTVMNEVTEDTGMASNPNGYAVREGYANFDTTFVTAAMSIPTVGQWSEPTPGIYGYYIIQYASDVAEGPVALEEVRDALYSSTLSTKVDEAFDAKVKEWIADAKFVVNTAPLDD